MEGNKFLFAPMAAVRPNGDNAQKVVAPPYDVVSKEEAAEKAKNNPCNFLHISRPEIDLPDGIDTYSDEVYQKAKTNFDKLLADKVLIREDKPCYYIYKMIMGDHSQIGIAGVSSVEKYRVNKVKKHEFTRPVKEDDRVKQVRTVGAQTGPILLAFDKIESVDNVIKKYVSNTPDIDVVGDYDVKHQIWVVNNDADIAEMRNGFDSLDAMYIADGHHRAAASSRVMEMLENEGHNLEGEDRGCLAMAFPYQDMKILDYNRVVKDLNGLSKEELIAKVSEVFEVKELDVREYSPANRRDFGMYLDGKWYQLNLKDNSEIADPVKDLDVSVLTDNILTPILGIEDLRKSKRIDFVGGIRGAKELERVVDNGNYEIAFSLYATSMIELMKVADSDNVMPPKSTWFEPKLADGLLSKKYNCLSK